MSWDLSSHMVSVSRTAFMFAFLTVLLIQGASSRSEGEENRYALSQGVMRGIICVTPQGDPSGYREAVERIADLGCNTINSFHGPAPNNDEFLSQVDRTGLSCIPSIHLICWIRLGDPPYPDSGPLGWQNILAWLKLYGFEPPDLPKPFDQGPEGTCALKDEELESQVQELVEGLGGPPVHNSLVGYYAFDEPSANAPGVVERMVRVHRAFCPIQVEKGDYPPPTITGIFLWNDDGQRAAREFLDRCEDLNLEKPPVLMYDCYVLSNRVGQDLVRYERYADIWYKIGEEFDIPVIVVPQGFDINGRPGRNELKAQAYMALAAGCKGINWFRLETLEAMGEWALEEVREVNADIGPISEVIMGLTRESGICTVSGCGGESPSGIANTFRDDNGTYFVFLASKDVVSSCLAEVAVDGAGLGYAVERVVDVHNGDEIGFEDDGEAVTFDYALSPGQGRLIMLEPRYGGEIPEAPILCLLLSCLFSLASGGALRSRSDD